MNLLDYFLESFKLGTNGEVFRVSLFFYGIFNLIMLFLFISFFPLLLYSPLSFLHILVPLILISIYFYHVGIYVIFKRIELVSRGQKKIKLFDNFGKAFLKAFPLSLGAIIFFLLNFIIICLFDFLNISNEYFIAFIVYFFSFCFFFFYMIFIGKTINNSFIYGIKQAFVLPFKKLKLWVYAIPIIISFYGILYVLALLPSSSIVIKMIVLAFLVGIFISFIYCFSKE
jgi:hypothetical protein